MTSKLNQWCQFSKNEACIRIVNQYSPMLHNIVMDHINEHDFCKSIKLCSRNGHSNLNTIVDYILMNAEEANINFPSIDKIMNFKEGNGVCFVCEFLAKLIQSVIKIKIKIVSRMVDIYLAFISFIFY